MSKEYTVYCHQLKSDGRRYFGITCQEINKRWQHGKAYRPEQYIRKAFEKYGWDAFDHIIVAEHLTQDEANQMERDLIAKYHTMEYGKGFNQTMGGDSVSGFHLTEATKAKLGKQISMYTLNGDYIRTFDTLTQAKKYIGGSNQVFDRMLKNNTNCCYGFQWKFGNDKNNIGKAQVYNYARTPITQYSLDGKLIKIYPNMKSACCETGVKSNSISTCCRGKSQTAGGYKWEYYLDYRGEAL